MGLPVHVASPLPECMQVLLLLSLRDPQFPHFLLLESHQWSLYFYQHYTAFFPNRALEIVPPEGSWGSLLAFSLNLFTCMSPAWTVLVCGVPHTHHRSTHLGLSPDTLSFQVTLLSRCSHIAHSFYSVSVLWAPRRGLPWPPQQVSLKRCALIQLEQSWLPAWHCIADPHYSWILLCVNLLTCRNVLVNPRSPGHQQCRKYESLGIQISYRGLTRALGFLVSAPLLLTVSLPHHIWHHISSIANVFVLKAILRHSAEGLCSAPKHGKAVMRFAK